MNSSRGCQIKSAWPPITALCVCVCATKLLAYLCAGIRFFCGVGMCFPSPAERESPLVFCKGVLRLSKAVCQCQRHVPSPWPKWEPANVDTWKTKHILHEEVLKKL